MTWVGESTGGVLLSFCNYELLRNSLLTLLTGMSTLERLLTNVTASDVLITGLAETAAATFQNETVKNSGTIRKVSCYLKSQGFGENVEGGMAPTMDEVKNIADRCNVRESLFGLLVGVINQITVAEACRLAIVQRQLLSVEPTDEQPKKALNQLWTSLQDHPLPIDAFEAMGSGTSPEPAENEAKGVGGLSTQRAGQCWREIGFHGYPYRDFRGMGTLGLDCLVYFAKNHPARAKEVLHDAHNVGQTVPFAITGLNVAMWVREMLDDGSLDIFFFNNGDLTFSHLRSKSDSHKTDSDSNLRQRGAVGSHESNTNSSCSLVDGSKMMLDPEFEEASVKVFCLIVAYAMLEFCRFWHSMRPSDILQFGRVSEKFKENFKRTIECLADEAAHGSWGLQANTGEELCDEMRGWIDGVVHPHQTTQHTLTSGDSSSEQEAIIPPINGKGNGQGDNRTTDDRRGNHSRVKIGSVMHV
eukprot:GHVN01075664.1.p1 GENE.GHVN01075664.1~~GHVN01075664.1.p1  ORF type:complete len:497 (+),score=70.48 GHVN01075664.1:76-1491(+)